MYNNELSISEKGFTVAFFNDYFYRTSYKFLRFLRFLISKKCYILLYICYMQFVCHILEYICVISSEKILYIFIQMIFLLTDI